MSKENIENQEEKKESTKKVRRSKSRTDGNDVNSIKEPEVEGVAIVIAKNESLYSVYRKLIGMVMIAFLAAILGIMSVFYFAQKHTPPKYVPVDAENRFIPLIPLNKPNVPNGTVTELALRTIHDVNSYDYINYKEQLQAASKNFTPRGWGAYLNQFYASNTIKLVQNGRSIVRMELMGNPIITAQSVAPNGVYAWKVDVPVKVIYVNHVSSLSGDSSQEGIVTLYIIRVPTTQLPEGIGVEIYQFDTSKKVESK